MARLGVSANEAFHLMMLASQRRQITLAAVAQEFDQHRPQPAAEGSTVPIHPYRR